MTVKEAKAILAASPYKDGQGPARINNNLTQAQAHKIVADWIESFPDDAPVTVLMLKRIAQVTKNRCRCEL